MSKFIVTLLKSDLLNNRKYLGANSFLLEHTPYRRDLTCESVQENYKGKIRGNATITKHNLPEAPKEGEMRKSYLRHFYRS